MKRTHYNGELRLENVEEEVSLIGWVARKRNFGSITFVDLRDRTGITQLVFSQDELPEIKNVKHEFIIQAKGIVRERQDKNPKLKTGDIEIEVRSFEVISEAEQTPMIIADETDALEDTRLKYRYLDLRRPIMQKRLVMRHEIVKQMRRTLEDMDFIEIETPLLTKSTPEGAREYLVPSRVHPGEFYALAQSPQIFKQLLMVSGFERYYQIARCFRDEDLRADRQLDFTQVDIEMSFQTQEQFMSVIEKIVRDVMAKVHGKTDVIIDTMSFDDAMNNYGSDKPDRRFDMKLKDISHIFSNTNFKVFESVLSSKGHIKAIVLENEAEGMSRKKQDTYTDLVKKYGLGGLVILKLEAGELTGSAVKFMSESEQTMLIDELDLKDNDVIFIASAEWETCATALGALRLQLAKDYELIREDLFDYLWIVDFPMFELGENGELVARHHPFTSPKKEHIDLLDSKPLDVKAQAYDLVLNGFEIAGGSMRIYNQKLQKKMFELIGFTEEEIERRFGFFVDAFKYGTPPHGGIAFGLDRFAMVLTQSETIRDVIAFPKNASARCPLTHAPSPATQTQMDDLHLKINE